MSWFRRDQYKPADYKQRNQALLDKTYLNPFPPKPATATPDNPPLKLFGREKETQKLLESFYRTAIDDDRPLIILQAETGVGKSALISKLFNEINKGKHDKDGIHLYAAYIEAYAEITDLGLHNFYRQIMTSLEKYKVMEKITIRVIQFLLQVIKDNDSSFYQETFSSASIPDYNEIHALLRDRKQGPVFIDKVIDGVGIVFYSIQERWKNFDSGLLTTLLRSQVQTKDLLKIKTALKGGRRYEDFVVSTKAQAKDVLTSFITLLHAINPNTAFILFIDQLEELFTGVHNDKQLASEFFKLVLALRQFPKTAIVLTGNNYAYKNLIDNLPPDHREQLDQWEDYMLLQKLKVEHVTQLVNYLLQRYWMQTPIGSTDHRNPFYPFSEKTIKYIYERQDKTLRPTLIKLNEIIKDMRENQEVYDLSDPIKAIGRLSLITDPLNLPYGIQDDFYQQMIRDDIQDKQRAQIPEDAIYQLFLTLKKHVNYITTVKKSPRLPKTGKKPDIYLEIGGNLSTYNQWKIGIEVKAYRRGEKIPKDDVLKTTVMLEKRDLDYVTWVTNVPLDEHTLESLEPEIQSKQLRTNEQTREETAYLYWAYIFQEAMNREPTKQETTQLLQKIGIPKQVYDLQALQDYDNARKAALTQAARQVTTEIITPAIISQPQESPSEPVKSQNVTIGLDIMDSLREFLHSSIDGLREKGRKQIRRTQLYNEFLSKHNFTPQSFKEEEFIEVLADVCKEKNVQLKPKILKL